MVRADAEAWALRLDDQGREARVRERDLVARTATFDEAEREALADEALADEELVPSSREPLRPGHDHDEGVR
jgi:hypothetical protein